MVLEVQELWHQHLLESGEGVMADGILMAGVYLEEITQQDRK
jgi:hypothetical protein